MAVYDLEEQEQISELKAWWAQYGNLVVGLALAAAVAAVGWQGWQWYQNRNAAEAGALYYAVQQAAESQDAQKAREAAGRLIGEHGGSASAQLGALLAAAVQFEADDLSNARAQLEWAADKGADAALRDLARLRLAAVMLEQGELDAALARLQGAPGAAYQSRYDDLRGDVLAELGRADEARAAYRAAIDGLAAEGEDATTLRELVRVKLESLGA
ncbi:tetratricopeptide repeat protein [Thauera chlorobenzoica]|uniref:TPR repeat protein n=1 Tax=Thauera chlorobenzoica TaxID=96773 RepID=A0A1H5UAL9_9RHOO|nr:tetratricopeptide repeat protein [Thauera chlorobenzoica]APR03818.1 TPR repeat protein [Thauera chlorobenzoica]SEF72080.1 Putative negative regulator of RcsB-dependent stress response [Thauera chlorobenzoica]